MSLYSLSMQDVKTLPGETKRWARNRHISPQKKVYRHTHLVNKTTNKCAECFLEIKGTLSLLSCVCESVPLPETTVITRFEMLHVTDFCPVVVCAVIRFRDPFCFCDYWSVFVVVISVAVSRPLAVPWALGWTYCTITFCAFNSPPIHHFSDGCRLLTEHFKIMEMVRWISSRPFFF